MTRQYPEEECFVCFVVEITQLNDFCIAYRLCLLADRANYVQSSCSKEKSSLIAMQVMQKGVTGHCYTHTLWTSDAWLR